MCYTKSVKRCYLFFYFIGIFLAFINRRRFSYEPLIFTLLIFLFFLYARGASLHAYDDFAHWGIFTKELLYSGFFEHQTSLTSIISTHVHYPIGAAVDHYFMLMLFRLLGRKCAICSFLTAFNVLRSLGLQ